MLQECCVSFNTCHNEDYWNVARSVLMNLKSTRGYGLMHEKSEKSTERYVDVDWAGNLISTRSRTGFAMKLSNGAVSWRSMRQTAAALSTTEAVYLAVSDATKDGVFLHFAC
jgi:hypothetical protein